MFSNYNFPGFLLGISYYIYIFGEFLHTPLLCFRFYLCHRMDGLDLLLVPHISITTMRCLSWIRSMHTPFPLSSSKRWNRNLVVLLMPLWWTRLCLSTSSALEPTGCHSPTGQLQPRPIVLDNGRRPSIMEWWFRLASMATSRWHTEILSLAARKLLRRSI